jgi:uncharacterized protein
MFKAIFLAGCLSLAIAIVPAPSLAVSLDSVPNPREVGNGWVSDRANVLSPTTEAQINRLVTELEAQNGSELAVVTVPQTTPLTPKEFATALFNRWRIGKRGQDNGVLFLISVEDRRTEVETGYGAESVLPDARVGRILDRNVIPYFRQGNYDRGILLGTQALASALAEATNEPVAPPAARNLWYLWVAATGGVVVATFGYRQMWAIAHRPIEITPEGYSRFRGGEPQDREVYWGAYIGSFGAAFTGLLLLWNLTGLGRTGSVAIDLIPAAIAGGIGSIPLSWLAIERLKGSDRSRRSLRPLHCAATHNPMQRLPDDVLSPRLTYPEQVAQQLKSVAFEGWHCPQCYPQLPNVQPPRWQRKEVPPGLHILAYELSSQFHHCPNCNELTMVETARILRHPTQYRTGLRLLNFDCQACSYHTEQEQIIPRTPPPVVIVSGGGSGGSGGSGGGGFGGGSSGGGGAGRGW